MLKRAPAVLAVACILTACTSPPGPYTGEVPEAADSTQEFGDSAEVVTVDIAQGVPVAWEVTVFQPVLVDATPAYPEVHCYPVTLTPTFIGDYPVDVTVALPEFTMRNGEEKANFFLPREDTEVCDLKDDEPSGYTGDLEVGKTYNTVFASWSGLYGKPATEVEVAGTNTVTWN